MKKTALLLGLSLLSSTAIANTYNAQVDVDYLKIDNFDVIGVEGSYYFDHVTTKNTAWAEAAFMGKNNRVSVGYLDLNGDAYTLNLGGDYYHNNIFVGLDVAYTDPDYDSSDTTLSAELGYFFAKDWLVLISGADEDFSDSLELSTKYIATLADGQFINIEASYLNLDSDFTASADYYWTAKSSVGLDLSTEEGYNFGVNAQHFFTPTIAARVSYISLDNDDAFAIGVTGRF